MIYNINPIDKRIIELENLVKSKINIPPELANNIKWRTTSLGGIFLDYCSNWNAPVTILNAKSSLFIYFDTCNGGGGYDGENIGFEAIRCYNVPKLIGVKKKISVDKAVDKINKYLEKNKQVLIDTIEK